MEDPHVRSVVCLDGTSEALPISAAYDAFVRKPTGVIERKYGHSVYRVDVSERISDGESWQLGLFAAHALYAADSLAGKGEGTERAAWLTGEVDRDLNVNPVDHVAEKLRQSAPLFAELEAADTPLTIFLPQGNAEGIRVPWGKIVALESVTEMCSELGLVGGAKSARPGLVMAAIGFCALLASVAGLFLWQEDILDKFGEYRNPIVAVVTEEKPEKKIPQEPALKLKAFEHRAVGHCPETFPWGATTNLVALEQIDAGHFAISTQDKLCAVEYGYRNASENPVHAWIRVSGLDFEQRSARQQNSPSMKYRKLAPGEEFSIMVLLPRWSKRPMKMRIIAAVGPNIPQDAEKWLAKAETDSLRRAGLTVRTVEHVINPSTKPRFN